MAGRKRRITPQQEDISPVERAARLKQGVTSFDKRFEQNIAAALKEIYASADALLAYAGFARAVSEGCIVEIGDGDSNYLIMQPTEERIIEITASEPRTGTLLFVKASEDPCNALFDYRIGAKSGYITADSLKVALVAAYLNRCSKRTELRPDKEQVEQIVGTYQALLYHARNLERIVIAKEADLKRAERLHQRETETALS
ncbi:MAG: hypothetical protein V1659_03980 [Candidatus Woesearchaeota archaeon]